MNVSKIHIHPEYENGTAYNNIAILSLENRISIDEIQPTCIWHGKGMPDSEMHLLGYGREDINTFYYAGSDNISEW